MVDTSLYAPEKRGGARPALLHWGTRGASWAKVAVGKVAAAGGPGPEFLAECCAHTPYLTRPCLHSREPATPAGREGGQHPQGSPSSGPFHPRAPKSVPKLVCVLSLGFFTGGWCLPGLNPLGGPAPHDFSHCKCCGRSFLPLVMATSRGTETPPSTKHCVIIPKLVPNRFLLHCLLLMTEGWRVGSITRRCPSIHTPAPQPLEPVQRPLRKGSATKTLVLPLKMMVAHLGFLETSPALACQALGGGGEGTHGTCWEPAQGAAGWRGQPGLHDSPHY